MPKKPEGPDQPRSWAIALAACVINTMLSGISRATGVLYVALIDEYGVSRRDANMPFTLRNSIRNLAGPIVGAIGQRYGARGVTIVGGIFGTVGIALCSIAPNVLWISIFWGVIHGLGVGMANTLFQVTVNQYFLKYRATALGLTLSGACVGSFVFPIALKYLLSYYGLAGSFLLVGGIIMHIMPACLMMTEPPWIRLRPETKLNIESSECQNEIAANLTKTPEELKSQKDSDKGVYVLDIRKVPSFETLPLEITAANPTNEVKTSPPTSLKNGASNPSFMGSKQSLAKEGCIEQANKDGAEASKSDPLHETSLYNAVLKIFCDPMFHMISLSLASFAILYDPSITVIVDYIIDKGLEEEAAYYLISALSLGDLLGRLCFGWVTDRNYLSVSKFMMLSQVVSGACFVLLPYIYAFDALLVIMVVYGVAAGISLVMFPVLVAKYLPTVQPLAIGCMAFFTGLLHFAVPPLIGHFRDNVGSYDGMFMINGGCCVVTGLFWLLEPLLLKLRTKLQRTCDSSNNHQLEVTTI